jgi:hypothetical protein
MTATQQILEEAKQLSLERRTVLHARINEPVYMNGKRGKVLSKDRHTICVAFTDNTHGFVKIPNHA